MPSLRFLCENARWLAAGFLMALGSSFGQTFFIAIFSEPLRLEFSISHGEFGTIYMVGTLLSAACLIQLGRLADTTSARTLSLLLTLCLATACLAMAVVGSWIMLVGVIFGLRLFGQGLLSHLSQTTMARWFHATRGRALAVASFGYPTGEAIAPLGAVVLMAVIGWRETWCVSSGVLAFVLAPTLWILLAKDRAANHPNTGVIEASGLNGRHWSRSEVLRQPLFWMLIPGLLGPGFILTAVFFLPSHIAEAKGWTFEAMPSRYWVYALTAVVASVLSGYAIDRFSARLCLPLYQLPMAAGLVALWSGTGTATIAALMVLIGATAGAAATVHSAIWAEIYGTRHIGTIKALAHSVMVFASAVGPGIVGTLIDLGIEFPDQALWLAMYTLGVSLLYAWVVYRGPLMRPIHYGQSW